MDSGTISVRMLGEFSITLNEKAITDTTNRSKKVWLLLAYMIYCRSRSIAPSDLTNLLWSEEESSSNPLNALKTVFHRVRSTLDQLGSSVGHSLILRKDGCYIWNQAVPLQLDTEEFDALCKAGAEAEGDARLAYYQKAQIFCPGFLQNPGLFPSAHIITISIFGPFWSPFLCWMNASAMRNWLHCAAAPSLWSPIRKRFTSILCADF